MAGTAHHYGIITPHHRPQGGRLPASAWLASATPSIHALGAIRRCLRGIIYDSPVRRRRP
jgi:hypothetical protein